MHVSKREGVAAAWERMVAWRAQLRGRTKRAAADRLLHFVRRRRERIRYPEFRQLGWADWRRPQGIARQTVYVRPERDSPVLAAFAAKVWTVPVNGYPGTQQRSTGENPCHAFMALLMA